MAFHTYHDITMPDPECLVNLRLNDVELPKAKETTWIATYYLPCR